MSQSPSYIASEDIAVSVFVSMVDSASTSAYNTIKTADAAEMAVGVSPEGPMEPVLPGGSVGAAILSGRSARIYGIGEECHLRASAAINSGKFLRPAADNSGRAEACGSGEKYSAIATSGAGAANELMNVLIVHGVVP